MKIEFKLTCLMALFVMIFAQATMGQVSKITVMHNGNAAFYGDLTAAVTAAAAGDTIYLPGGGINPASQVIINKKLTIVGAGHYPDSTIATNPTIVSYITLITGADNGSISGCKLNSISFGTTANNQTVNNYRIERCYIVSLYLNYSGTSTSQGIIVRENVIDPSVYGEVSSILFEKNIFRSGLYYSSPAVFNNNIFYCSSSLNVDNSIINNNIIIASTSYTISLGSNSVYNNNLFCTTSILGGGNYNCGSTNVCNNNLSDQMAVNTFVNATTTNFSYANNYHLLSSSPAKNYGTDGTDLGIYGTLYPYKEAAMPFNPHIGSKNIGTVVSPTGNLSVDMKVSAQDR